MAGEHSGAVIASGDAQFVHVQTTTDSREDGIERAEEWIVMLKLPADRYPELAEFLTERHSYDEPEIIATPIVAGSAGYLDWIAEETAPR
jgi:periplasmic divalent cation tolerance protein